MTQRDFEPAAEQDVDDEATIEEEETLEAGEGFNQDELDDLQKVRLEFLFSPSVIACGCLEKN